MKHQAGNLGAPGAAVDGIAADRMADVLHVHANLMGAAGENVHIHQRHAAAGCEHRPFGDGFAAFGIDRHLLAVLFAAGNGGLNAAVLLSEGAVHQRAVVLFHQAVQQLLAQRQLGGVILGDQQQAGGILVQPVDDARAQLAADASQAVQMMQQGVDQRAVLIAGGGMHHHAAGLHHHSQVAVLVEDGEGNVLCLGNGWSGRGHRQADGLAGLGLQGRLGFNLAVYGHLMILHQGGNAAAGQAGDVCQQHVDAAAVAVALVNLLICFHGSFRSNRRAAAGC